MIYKCQRELVEVGVTPPLLDLGRLFLGTSEILVPVWHKTTCFGLSLDSKILLVYFGSATQINIRPPVAATPILPTMHPR